jgi:NAD(P)-dependent dehydrogenase (short-subunit alcohol dehydrogenase family)
MREQRIEDSMIGIDLSGKTALVCGAGGGGLGSAVSRVLAQAGANLVAVDQNEEFLAETKAEVAGLGAACETIVANLMDADVAAGLVGNALSKVERIDIVVNVAGGTRFDQWSPIEETTDAVFHDVLALNLNYVFRVCADVARHMIAAQHPGSMINFASISGLRSAPFHGPYGIAKRGVMAMTETMAIEWARYGIRINTVAPGGVRTPRANKYRGSGSSERRSTVSDGLRLMTPPEVASAVLFLASDLAAGISGQTLVVDSGLSAKNPAGGVKEYAAVMEAANEQATAG